MSRVISIEAAKLSRSLRDQDKKEQEVEDKIYRVIKKLDVHSTVSIGSYAFNDFDWLEEALECDKVAEMLISISRLKGEEDNEKRLTLFFFLEKRLSEIKIKTVKQHIMEKH